MMRMMRIVVVLLAISIVVLVGACTSDGGDRGGAPPDAAGALAIATSLASKDARLAKLLEPRRAGEGFESEGADERAFTSPGWRGAKEQRWSDLGARLPARSDGELEVGVSQFPALRLRLVPEGAQSALGELRDGHVVYSEAYGAGVDVVMTTTRESVEELFVLREGHVGRDDLHAAPRASFAWRVTLPAGISRTVITTADGGLELQDARGERVLGIPAPYAVDARGQRRAATLSWEHRDQGTGRLHVELEMHGLSFPVLLDPAFQLARWNEVKWPTSNSDQVMAYDAARGRVVLFGPETFTWDGDGWAPAPGAGSPPGRQRYAVAYDAARGNLVLYGGAKPGGGFNVPFSDTWIWDGTSWTETFPATSPPPYAGHAMAYDAARRKVVLLGSDGQTWTWDGVTWTNALPAASPGRRVSSAMTYDAARGKVVLFGGQSASGNDTWTWDGTTWTQAFPALAPSPRYGHTMAFDVARGRVVLFGGVNGSNTLLGDTWTWDGASWTSVAVASPPAARAFHAMAYDALRAKVIVFGGAATLGPAGAPSSNDTWSWDGTGWSAVSLLPAPPGRDGHAMVYDAARTNVLLFAGRGFADTWTWNGTTWRQSSPSSSPPGRSQHRMAYDAARGNVVLFGGLAAGGAALNDTWTWNGITWNQAFPATSPPARALHAMAYDTARGNVVLFGGGNGLGDTWTWNGATWKQAFPATSPPARSFHAMASDDAHRKVVLFGGMAPSDVNDTWTWDGATWTNALPAGSPGTRHGHAMAYDTRRGKVILFGGVGGDLFLPDDTWTWDGVTWAATPTNAPPGCFESAMAFDDARGKVVLFSGRFNSNATWLYSARGGRCALDAQCDSGFCTDGVCCDVPFCGTCQACNSQSTPGICAPLRNTVDGDSCTGASACDPSGACRPATGQACTTGAQCASGFCTDGVCCEKACAGQCESCGIATSKGRCVAVRGAPLGGRQACGAGPAGNICAAPACNGTITEACAGFAGAEVACRAPSCVAGVATLPASCKGNALCPDRLTVTCAPYACAGQACATKCASDAECDPKFSCDVARHECTARGAALCDGDHTLVALNGTKTDCAPFKCEGVTCKATCNSIVDCAYPSECDAVSHTCVAPLSSDGSSGSGCATSASTGGGHANRLGALVVTACLAALARRRRRSRRDGLREARTGDV